LAADRGLSAGTRLAQAKCHVLLLEKESFGGPIINIEWINGYGPRARARRSRARSLASEMGPQPRTRRGKWNSPK